MKYKVIDNKTNKVVYESDCLGHSQIYINTSGEPWNYSIVEED